MTTPTTTTSRAKTTKKVGEKPPEVNIERGKVNIERGKVNIERGSHFLETASILAQAAGAWSYILYILYQVSPVPALGGTGLPIFFAYE